MGSSMMMGMMIVIGVGIGLIVGAPPNESTFVASCLSLSSTPLVVRFLTPERDSQAEDSA